MRRDEMSENIQQPAEKRPYSTPKLVPLGSVGALTLGGSAGAGEGKGSKKPPGG